MRQHPLPTTLRLFDRRSENEEQFEVNREATRVRERRKTNESEKIGRLRLMNCIRSANRPLLA
jgi:hypothetical protein